MPGGERAVVESELLQRSRTEVLDEDVRLGGQAIERCAPVRMFEIERDAFLVAVDAQEVRAFTLEEWRAPRSSVIAFARLLDLDHARTHIGEQHRAVRAGEHARQIED